MTKAELQQILSEEKRLYVGESPCKEKAMKKSQNRRYVIWRYLMCFRRCCYWKSVREDRSASRFSRLWAKRQYHRYDRQRNLLSERCGVEIGLGSRIGRNLDIWHGGVVINGTLGDDCTIHGNCIIGNKGKGRERETPVIGDRVDIGVGAVIIGRVTIAPDCSIGAGAVITKSFIQSGSVIVGVPGEVMR